MGTSFKILVTGATGFVGKALTLELLKKGFQVRMVGQVRETALEDLGAEWFPMPDLAGEVDWQPVLAGMDGVVHLAGIAHRAESGVDQDVELYDKVNHRATSALAQAIAAVGTVRRFLFVSTVRVHGDPVILPVCEDSPLAPVVPYDHSKVAAEAAIRRWLRAERVQWAILRPVLVYGPGNRGNMARLEGIIRRGVPIPVPRQPNRRSFLFLGNLVAAISEFMSAPDVPSGRTWIVADEGTASTEQLALAMAAAMAKKVRILHLSGIFLRSTARGGDLLRRVGLASPWNSEVLGKLLGNFYVDSSAIKTELHWTPPYTLEEGIMLTYREPKG